MLAYKAVGSSIVNGVKVADQLTELGGCPGGADPMWSQVSLQVEGDGRERTGNNDNMRDIWLNIDDFQIEEQGHEPRNAGNPLMVEKLKEQFFP